MSVESPCIGICQIDSESGYCLGCGRDLTEIRAWKTADDQQKQDIVQKAQTRPTPRRGVA